MKMDGHYDNLNELSKKHEFELSQTCGTFVYSVDDGPQVALKFTSKVCLKVFVNLESALLPSVSDNGDIIKGEEKGEDEDLSTESLLSDIQEDLPENRGYAEYSATNISEDPFRAWSSGKPNDEKRHLAVSNWKQEVEISLPKAVVDEDKINSNIKGFKHESQRKLSVRLSQKRERENAQMAARKKAMKEEKDRASKCEYCLKQFQTMVDFYNHRLVKKTTHICSVCGKVEPYKAYLNIHMETHHSSRSVQVNEAVAEHTNLANARHARKKKPRRLKIKMECSSCGKVLSSIDSLKLHAMSHTGELPYQCCICEEKFPYLTRREHHMTNHFKVNRFRCTLCELKFPSRTELASHQLTHQPECSICDQIFPNKTSLKAHLRTTHPDDILKCDQCSALFSCQDALARHKDYHARVVKKQCLTCGHFVSNLKRHMQIHSSSPKARLFQCDQCPMSYSRHTNLKRHLRTHTGERPYACDQCPKRYSCTGILRRHLLSHTQEKSYQCNVCGKQFALWTTLSIHMRIHDSIKRFSCHFCKQAFNYKSSLQGHMRSKHSISQFPETLPTSTVTINEETVP